jgi:hypothetical protein
MGTRYAVGRERASSNAVRKDINLIISTQRYPLAAVSLRNNQAKLAASRERCAGDPLAFGRENLPLPIVTLLLPSARLPARSQETQRASPREIAAPGSAGAHL